MDCDTEESNRVNGVAEDGIRTVHSDRLKCKARCYRHCDETLNDDEYVITRKKSRESGALDVLNDQTEAFSKGLDVGTTKPAGFAKAKKTKSAKRNDREEIFKRNFNEKTTLEHNAEKFVLDNKKSQEFESVDMPDGHGMPRLYARIRRVFSPEFELEIKWLDANPDDPDHLDWVRAKLPVSCGKFKHGMTRFYGNVNIFSHTVICLKNTTRGLFEIYPGKGEIWALFKNWDIKWSSDPGNHTDYEYDFVEILTDYNDRVGIIVAWKS
ncbi:hypothetical protein IFM89_035564 [Coptis chinensis]|uniref:DUF3444 domain-containing protein n=1 Tax=Coptis chinensis TaxID=261450 RepID=A0A835HXA5_9MAGN|nr:hypothetical protein IFM89_035564 [Coptis chinensis]